MKKLVVSLLIAVATFNASAAYIGLHQIYPETLIPTPYPMTWTYEVSTQYTWNAWSTLPTSTSYHHKITFPNLSPSSDYQIPARLTAEQWKVMTEYPFVATKEYDFTVPIPSFYKIFEYDVTSIPTVIPQMTYMEPDSLDEAVEWATDQLRELANGFILFTISGLIASGHATPYLICIEGKNHEPNLAHNWADMPFPFCNGDYLAVSGNNNNVITTTTQNLATGCNLDGGGTSSCTIPANAKFVMVEVSVDGSDNVVFTTVDVDY